MLNVILSIPSILSKYFKRFKKALSKKMGEIYLYYLAGLFLEYKRFNLSQLDAKAPCYCYEQMQYFISEAKWDESALNQKRIKDLNGCKQTKSSEKGVLIIDDTSNKKSKNCKITDTVARQYSTKDDAVVNCQVSVYSCYADVKKSWPIDFKPYWPEKAYFRTKDPNVVFKSKIELGMQLIEEAMQMIRFRYVVFDNWYLSNEMILFCYDKKLMLISEVDVDRWVRFQGKWLKGGELVKLAREKKLCLKSAHISTRRGKKLYFYYEFTGKLKEIPHTLRFIITSHLNEEGEIQMRLLATNDLKSPAKIIIQGYELRWQVEVTFERLKDCFYLDQFQVRSVRAFSRHYYLCMTAYSFILKHLLCGSFTRMTSNPVKTFEEAIKLLRDLITIESFYQADGNVRRLLNNKDLRLKRIPA